MLDWGNTEEEFEDYSENDDSLQNLSSSDSMTQGEWKFFDKLSHQRFGHQYQFDSPS